MNTIFQIIKQQDYHRILFLHREDGRIVGLNFHYDCGDEPMESYYEPDCKMTNIYNLLSDIKDEEQRINASIEIFLFNRKHSEPPKVDGKVINIPQSQRDLIRNAIGFYMQAIQSLEEDYADSRRHDIFDLNVLAALCNYPTSVRLTEAQCKTFGSLYGYDLPEYVY